MLLIPGYYLTNCDAVTAITLFLISKILQLGSKIPEFKARFEPLNSQSKLKTPVYHLPAEESCESEHFLTEAFLCVFSVSCKFVEKMQRKLLYIAYSCP